MITFCSLLFFWFVLANSFQPIDFVYAIISISISLYIRKKFFQNHKIEIKKLNIFSPKFLFYLIWIIVEMVKAAIAVLKITYSNQKTDSNFITVQAIDVHNYENLILAHSITFTPGTITVAMRDDQLIVHSLTNEMGESLKNDKKLYKKIHSL